MTTLTIIPSHGSKMARFAGSVAAGELVQVTIVGAADWISPDGESQTLRLRVVAMSSGATLAEFRRGETAAWTATSGNAVCTLNLNTVEMLSAVPKHARRPFLFVLDDAESHTLYFKSAYPVSHWPQRTGEDAPADLGGYRDFVEECKEAMRGAEGSALESAQHAAQSEDAAQSAKSAAESSALNASGSANLAGEYAARAEAAKSAIDGRNYINGAVYDSNTKKILLKNGDRVVAEIDATAFVKDGMVSSVVISGGNLVITFNTDAGQQPISIPITDIFNPSLYYTKTEADTKFAAKQDKLYRIVWAFAGTTADAQAFVAASANLALENVAPKTFELSGYDTTSYYVIPVVTTNPDPTDLTFVLMDAAMTSMLGMVTATRSEVAVSSHVVDEIGDTSNIPTSAAVKKSIDDLSGKIPEKATSAPLMAGTAAVGSSNKYASENHVHPAETEVMELYAPVSLPASAFPVTYTYTNSGASEVVELNVSNVTYYDGGSTWLLQDNKHSNITLCEFNKDGTFQYAWQQAEDIKFNGVAPVANASPCLVSDNMKVRVRGGKFVTFGDFDTSPTKDSRKAVKSGGIWSAIWGALASLPTGFSSLYDWCVSQLAGKLSLAGGAMNGPISGIQVVSDNNRKIHLARIGLMQQGVARKGAGNLGVTIELQDGTNRECSLYIDDDGKVYINTPTGYVEVPNATAGGILALVSQIPPGASVDPLMNGAASPGSATTWARSDHVHPKDTSKQDTISDLETIRTGASAGATAVQKVSGATAGNLASLTAAGGIQDAGYHFEVRNGIPCIVQYT